MMDQDFAPMEADPRLEGPSQGGTDVLAADSAANLPGAEPVVMSPEQLVLLKQIRKTIKDDKKHFEDDFKRMRRDMKIVREGRDDDWHANNYTANIIGRHVSQKTNALYAKNPKAVSRRRETLDFQQWDENQSSLQIAMQTLMQAQASAQQAQAMQSGQTPAIDQTGNILPAPQLPPGFEQAQALLQDFQQGMMRREQIKRIGKTLEILFAQAMREQKPLDFKSAMKRVVRRACTTGVAYVKVGFQRKMGPRTGLNEQLADAQERLAHLQALIEDQSDDSDFDSCTEEQAEQAELQNMIAALSQEPETVLREGLVFDYPLSTRVIPDKTTQAIVGFVGANHLTLEYLYTKDQVKEIWGVELDKFTEFTSKGASTADDYKQADLFDNSDATGGQFACVWEHYDKPSGLVYYLVDGFDTWLRMPGPPDVVVDDFWPVYALTFNETESEDKIFPESDVGLLLHPQKEYNRSREGKRQHRKAAIPRFLFAQGSLDEEAISSMASAKPFEAIGVNVPPEQDIRKIISPVPVPGVDPNLYDVNEIMSDMQFIVGTQQAQLGGTSKATATESAIAASASASSDTGAIDELDSFLTNVVRAAGQVLMGNMTEEQVMKVVGPGAAWPAQTMQDIAEALFLEIEAGSTGKPNQAIEIQNWTNMLPFLIQMKGIDPIWLARETLRRLDDRMDLTEAIAEGAQSMVAANRAATSAPPQPGGPPPQIIPGQPSGIPEAQGPQGAQNAPAPPSMTPDGSGPAFGSNQV